MSAKEEPASIRTNDPGAMWGKHNAIAAKWGASQTIGLNDGLGQGNNIAVFPTKVQGAAAQFDLWRASYTMMTLKAAIAKWSGGNSSSGYIADLERKTGIGANDVITSNLLAGPRGLALMKAQADWEAGKPYPMSDAEWQTAQNMVFHGAITPQQLPPRPSVPSAPVIPLPTPKPAPRPATYTLAGAIIDFFARWFKGK